MRLKNQCFFLFLISFYVVFIALSCQETSPKNSNVSEPNPSEMPISTPEIIAPNPIDSTDTFTIIPQLESYLETPIFGKDFKFFIESPQQNFRHPLQNNQFMLRVKGKVEAISGKTPTDFQLRLFSNNVADFQANQPIEKWNISFKNDSHPYQFKHSSILNIPAGIYYFTIEQTSSNERFYVGKIFLL